MYQLPAGTAAPTNGALHAPPPRGDEDFGAILAVLGRRRKLFWQIFLGFNLLVTLFTAFFPPTYQADAKMIAGSASANPFGSALMGANTDIPVLNALIAAGGSGGVQSIETYAELVQEYPVAEAVEKKFGIKQDAYDFLRYHVTVTPVTNTEILDISVTWPDRKESAALANEFANVFVQRERDLVAEQSASAMNFLSNQLPVSKKNMDQADSRLIAFQSTHNLADLQTQTQSTVAQFSNYNQLIAMTQVDMEQAQAQLGNVQGQIASNAHTVTSGQNVAENPVVTQLKQQLAQVDVQLATARKQYTDAHPTVIALQQQKDTLQKEIASQPQSYVASSNVVVNPVTQQLQQTAAALQAQVAADSGRLNNLKQQLALVTGSVKGLPSDTITFQNLQRDAQLKEGLYSALQQRLQEATLAQNTMLSDIAVSQPAEAGLAKPFPAWSLDIPVGIILGLLLAISGVYVVDFFDSTLKDENDVRRVLPFPILTTVPNLEVRGKEAQSALPWLRLLTIESFLQLVTALRYSSAKPLHTIAFTSPGIGDGKSMVALNAAIAMAEMKPRVLLVDADMRCPTLHERLGVHNESGLTDVLIGEADATSLIQSTRYAGLDVLTAGKQAPNPVKLIESDRWKETFAALRERYDTIVFDTPALVPIFDGAAIGARVDGTVLVVAAGKTEMRPTSLALMRLGVVEGVNVLGVVLNRVTPSKQESQNYYYLQGSATPPLAEGEIVE